MRRTLLSLILAVVPFLGVGSAQARGFTAPDLYLAYLKLTAPQDLATYVPEYRLHFAPPMARQANEFDGQSEDDRLLATLKRNVEKFDVTEPFDLPLTFAFGEYDFGKKSFNFHPLRASDTFNASTISVVFVNTRQFDGLPMTPDAAKLLLARSPGRQVAATVSFVPVEAVEDTNRVKTRIVAIDLFSDPGRQNLLLTMRPQE